MIEAVEGRRNVENISRNDRRLVCVKGALYLLGEFGEGLEKLGFLVCSYRELCAVYVSRLSSTEQVRA